MAGHGSPPPENKANHPNRQVGRDLPPTEQYDSHPGAWKLRPRWNDDDAWSEGRTLNREGYD